MPAPRAASPYRRPRRPSLGSTARKPADGRSAAGIDGQTSTLALRRPLDCLTPTEIVEVASNRTAPRRVGERAGKARGATSTLRSAEQMPAGFQRGPAPPAPTTGLKSTNHPCRTVPGLSAVAHRSCREAAAHCCRTASSILIETNPPMAPRGGRALLLVNASLPRVSGSRPAGGCSSALASPSQQ